MKDRPGRTPLFKPSFAFIFLFGVMIITQLCHPAAAADPDFTVTAVNFLSVQLGSSDSVTVTLSSLNGFAGNVTHQVTMSNPYGTGLGPTSSVNPITVSLTAHGSSTVTLTVSTENAIDPGSYTITVTGTSGSLSHSISIALTVATADYVDRNIDGNRTAERFAGSLAQDRPGISSGQASTEVQTGSGPVKEPPIILSPITWSLAALTAVLGIFGWDMIRDYSQDEDGQAET